VVFENQHHNFLVTLVTLFCNAAEAACDAALRLERYKLTEPFL
jgi:hypothetical protein